MKSRVIRAPDQLWDAARAIVSKGTEPRRVVVPLEGDETLGEAVRKFLERFIR